MNQDHPVPEQENASSPFEGPEKLLEIWFTPSEDNLPHPASVPIDGRTGLRKIPREAWEEMLAIVQCKVLSYIQGDNIDAYLLSESSFFVSSNRVILKTCGTTLNLLGLPRILEIAREQAGFHVVHRLFYSRKSFMFPDRQQGPHRDWRDEVQYLDNIFSNGSAYTVGKVNGDHWLLYMASQNDNSPGTSCPPTPSSAPPSPVEPSSGLSRKDYTIEILMTQLSPKARSSFVLPDSPEPIDPSSHAITISQSLGITELFPPHLTQLDGYAFDPCGYSSNAILSWQDPADPEQSGEGYYTIHVTPEDGWSYASFECNVPLATTTTTRPKDIPDLETLVKRVVDIFHPGKLSLTLFISSSDNETADDEKESEVERAQRAFKRALSRDRTVEAGTGPYRRTDKINYEFGGYDLAFASFELS
ncbi:S-adenosylmethionine decarboxylase [Pterulicium gracile]|uniref:adenosylmethionine decarboxylase n=1 Tax=Pterulicium gracile TaxID=1884261 RepID=A0A5C3QHJ2_9AGAR|nr:S-adenosylmethionine decarboxylase [Pterula gracilis]